MEQETHREPDRRLLTIKRLHSSVRGLFIDAEEWDDFSEMDQLVYSLEWDNYVGKIESLERSYRAHEFTDEQRKVYEDLKRDVIRVLPVLERLELAKPRLSEGFS